MTTANETEMETMIEQNAPPALPVATRCIDIQALKRGLEKVRARVGGNELAQPLPIVPPSEGLVIQSESGVFFTKDSNGGDIQAIAASPEAANAYLGAASLVLFVDAFKAMAERSRLFGDTVELDAFVRHLALRLVPNYSHERALDRFIDLTLQVAQEINDAYVGDLRKKADAGDAGSQYQLYEILDDKSSAHYDRKAASVLLKQSAYQAWPDACDQIFRWGKGTKRERARLLAHLHKLGQQGNHTAVRLWASEILADSGRAPDDKHSPKLSDDPAITKDALRTLQRLSSDGDAEASLTLSGAYELDKCVAKDLAKAARLIQRAEKQGSPWAAWIIGCRWLDESSGRSADFRKASKMFLRCSHLLNGGMPNGGEGHYVWAYACLEAGLAFPTELRAGLDRLRAEDGYRAWSYELLDALVEHAKSGNTDLFRRVIFQADEDWHEWEFAPPEDESIPYDDFFQTGKLDLSRNLVTLEKEEMRCSFPMTIDRLRAIANKGDHVVKYLLGLMGDTADDWLGLASDGRFALASYHLGFSRYADEPEAALRHLRRVAYQSDENLNDFPEKFAIRLKEYDETKEIVSEEFFREIRNKALDRIQEVERQLAEQRSRELTLRDTLSYLTHTLNNILSGRPEAARQAVEILGSEMYENDAGYTAINNIASMLSTFLFAQQLMNTFKLYVADPDALRKNWETDRDGDATITTVLAASLRQTLSQIVFATNHLSALKRLLPHQEPNAIKNIRKSFMDEMVPLDVRASNAQTVFDWVRDHVGIVHVTIDPAAELHFHSNSTRFTFFFSGFTELIFNALKYSDTARPIEISWGKSGKAHVFRCENSWSEDSLRREQVGSGKGLVFVERMVKMLGASLEKQIAEDRFIAEIRFPENLFKGAS